jgi:hypothetical protein
VGLVGGDVAFVAVGFVCGGVGSARVSVHVWDVAASEWLELLVMVSSSSEHVTVEAATADRISSGCAVWSVWEFDALFEPVGASVFFCHASPDSIPFGVVGDIFPALVDDWAAVTDGFGTFHLGGVATVEEEQVGSAFASCPVFPSVEEVGMVGLVHS